MCGQVGLILGPRRRRARDYQTLAQNFTALLLSHEVRGPHATGVAWLQRDGTHRIEKEALNASAFIQTEAFQSLTDEVCNQTHWLAGHTRWVTRGTPRNNRNNHPIRGGTVIGTHNGTLVNVEQLTRRMNLARQTEVDSEVLVRLVAGAWGEEGLNLSQLKSRLSYCQGQMSAVFWNKLHPHQILLLHGNKPLFVQRNQTKRLVAYASRGEMLSLFFPHREGWEPVRLPPNHLMVININDLDQCEADPFGFMALSRIPALGDAS